MSFLSSILPRIRGRIALSAHIRREPAWAFAFFVAFTGLSACGPASSSAERGRQINTQPAIAAISVPPGINDRPLQPGQSGTEYMPNGLPALAPARGVNADTMFAEKLSSDEARFRRLENAVADMRREFESVKPAIVRLSAVESDLEELVAQLQTLIPGAGGASPAMPAPPGRITIDSDLPLPDIGPMPESQARELTETRRQPQPALPPVEAPPTPLALVPEERAASPPAKAETPKPKDAPKPAAAQPAAAKAVSGKQEVSAVRVGENGGKTRLVIDVGAKTAFTHNLDNGERLLMIELPQAAWNTAMQAQLAKAPLLQSWTATRSGSGVILAVQLRKNAEIVSASTLAASGTQPFRIIFDLKPAP